MYGDRGVLGRHFGAMSRWMDFVARGNPDYLRSTELGNSHNDRLAPVDDHTPPLLLATVYWAYDAALMAEISTVLDRAEDAAEYRALREKVGSAFADAFAAADGSVASGSGGFQSAWMNSFNHYSLGSVAEWLYQSCSASTRRRGLPGSGSCRCDRTLAVR